MSSYPANQQPYGTASPANPAHFPSYQPSSAQLLGGFSQAQPTPDWMGPWSPAVYGKMDTPSAVYGSSRQQSNLFDMSFRNGGLHSPGLPESNTRGSFSAVEEDQSHHQQGQQQWPQPRKRALSSPALFWEGGNRAQGSYFDQQPPAPYQSGHQYSNSVGQDQVRQSPQQNNNNNQLQTHPAMHDSIQAISTLASFNQGPAHQQHNPQHQSQPSPAPHATRQATRAPPTDTAPTSAETSPAMRATKRQRKGSNGQQESSVSPKQEDNDELEEESARPTELLGPDGKPDPMDAEAQRKDLLDRNRIAARKSREKRKREVQALETTIRNYTNQNASLHSLTVSLSAELQQLRELLSNHTQCVHGGMGNPMMHQQHQHQHQPQPIVSGGRRR